MSSWVRVWDDMIGDPKWRVIARRSGARLSDVVTVWVAMMTVAGRADPRGTLAGWDDEDQGALLDMDVEMVSAIREAMQGKVLDGDALTGWERRQPTREDDSAGRVRALRERRRAQGAENQALPVMGNACERGVTHCNAPDTESDTDTEEENPPRPPLGRSDDDPGDGSASPASAPASGQGGPPRSGRSGRRRRSEDVGRPDQSGRSGQVEALRLMRMRLGPRTTEGDIVERLLVPMVSVFRVDDTRLEATLSAVETAAGLASDAVLAAAAAHLLASHRGLWLPSPADIIAAVRRCEAASRAPPEPAPVSAPRSIHDLAKDDAAVAAYRAVLADPSAPADRRAAAQRVVRLRDQMDRRQAPKPALAGRG